MKTLLHLIAAALIVTIAGCLLVLADNQIVPYAPTHDDRVFLEDLERRSVMYFWEQAEPSTGLVLDRASIDGGRAKGPSRDIASIAATGFGLASICIGVEHGWIPRDQAVRRVRATLDFFLNHADAENGWFYHWMDASTGERRWDSETSSVDTAFLLGGVLTAGEYFSDDPEIKKLAQQIFERVDFKWMFDSDTMLLSHGWMRGKGFLKYRWDVYGEESLLYLLAIGSPTHPIDPESWYAWQRPYYSYDSFDFISGGPLFTHQYSHAWVDFRNRRDRGFVDFFLNSVYASRANHAYCLSLNDVLPNTFGPQIWGITASDGPKGYRIYGEIKAFDPVDGTVAPSAAGGSLMFTPELSIPALRGMVQRYGERVYGRYGFIDAYNPSVNWFDSDVVGIDVGITALSAENLLTGNVWRWFMRSDAISRGMTLAGFSEPPHPETPAPSKNSTTPSKRTRKQGAVPRG